jgi:formylglycine-generating enzyme required for sulfatase activity
VFRIYGGQGRLWHTEFPKRRIFLDDYLIGKYEVLNRQYKIFVDETGHRSPRVNYDWGKPYNWVGNNYPEGMGDYPVVLVSWEDAEEYCRWAGLSLPTEAQWEKAARGIDGRKYPWGDKWDPARCNCAERLAGRNLESLSAWLSWWSSKGSEVVKTVQTQRAGCYCSGASPCGGLDMAGNAWEWCEDWYKAYPGNVCKCGKAGKSCKCSGFGEKFRACRGGSWYDDWSNCRTTFRFRFLPDFQSSCSGFRVCLMPEDRKSKSRKSGAP